jgi:hypothetical protein
MRPFCNHCAIRFTVRTRPSQLSVGRRKPAFPFVFALSMRQPLKPIHSGYYLVYATDDVRSWSNSGRHLLAASISGFDPHVWSGRASQEVFVDLASAVLHQCIRSLELVVLGTIMDISARAFSLADRPQRAIWVTSVRMRREDRSSISSYSLADLGG